MLPFKEALRNLAKFRVISQSSWTGMADGRNNEACHGLQDIMKA
jgi:hypothetical protein